MNTLCSGTNLDGSPCGNKVTDPGMECGVHPTKGVGGMFADDRLLTEEPRFGPLEEDRRQKGCYRVDSAIITRTERREGGWATKSFAASGDPHRAAEVNSAIAAFSETYPLDEAEYLDKAKEGAKVTVLRKGRSAFGASSVEAMEGTLFMGGSGVGFLPKGKRKNGIRMGPEDVLAYKDGYVGPALAEQYRDVARQMPEMEETHFEGIPEYDSEAVDNGEEPPSDIAAAFSYTHQGFGMGETQVIFLATDVDREDGIVNGYMWAPKDSGLISEHGSIYFDDLRRRGGRVKNLQEGLTFSGVMGGELGETTNDAYARVGYPAEL